MLYQQNAWKKFQQILIKTIPPMVILEKNVLPKQTKNYARLKQVQIKFINFVNISYQLMTYIFNIFVL